jgi:hypothetical protein
MGEARFVGERTLDVALADGGMHRISGERVFLDLGTHATVPDVPGLVAARPMTHVELLDLDRLRRIVEHNRLNGVIFSTVEFLLVAAAAAFIGVGMVRLRWPIGAVLALGTALNALVIVAFGAVAWRRGERGTSLIQVFNANHRAELSQKHPHLMAATLIVAAAALAPFVLIAAVALESARPTSPKHPS